MGDIICFYMTSIQVASTLINIQLYKSDMCLFSDHFFVRKVGGDARLNTHYDHFKLTNPYMTY